ncbi:MAG: hypothetical protein M3Y69_06505 [Verrucomicrobiota bacterium]|nr:hypothetical protein [Verrucomicrobiota bacterium]
MTGELIEVVSHFNEVARHFIEIPSKLTEVVRPINEMTGELIELVRHFNHVAGKLIESARDMTERTRNFSEGDLDLIEVVAKLIEFVGASAGSAHPRPCFAESVCTARSPQSATRRAAERSYKVTQRAPPAFDAASNPFPRRIEPAGSGARWTWPKAEHGGRCEFNVTVIGKPFATPSTRLAERMNAAGTRTLPLGRAIRREGAREWRLASDLRKLWD